MNATATPQDEAAALARIAPLDQARAALAECRTDLERLRLRDVGRAAQAAALILERRDVQVSASLLVQDAERAIHEANPPKTSGGQPSSSVFPEHTQGVDEGPELSASVHLRHIRAVHSKLTSEQYAAAVRSAEAQQEPLTRKALAAVARARAEGSRAPRARSARARGARRRAAQARVRGPRRRTKAQADARNPDLLIARIIELEDQLAGQKTVISGIYDRSSGTRRPRAGSMGSI